MDGDEGLAMFAGIVGTVAFVVFWYPGLATVTTLGGGGWVRGWAAVVPVGCLLGLQFFLVRFAAHEVREDPAYDFLFMAGGGAWLGLTMLFMGVAGLSVRDDVIEARNAAAMWAASGALAGMTVLFAGANAGEGPTIWTTYVPAFVGAAVMLLLWLVLEAASGVSEAIAVDRDVASGVRLAGFLLAVGLVLGRACAGDWHSWEGTMQDFVSLGWPAALLLVPAAVFQARWTPSAGCPSHPVVRRGVIPALCLCGGAGAWVVVSTVILHMGGH